MIVSSITPNQMANEQKAPESILSTSPPKDTKPKEISIRIETEEEALTKKPHIQSERPFHLLFEDLFYEVGNESNSKVILNNISGSFKSGEVTAIIGPSGCGKTSLLNFITNRINFPMNSKHSGKLSINNEEINPELLSLYSSYVMQDDVLFHLLTPFETFKFISRLKAIKTDEEHNKEADGLIKLLKLEKCRDTLIGNNLLKGISGGEKKRVSIGCEIISKPSILFLDEPTSGLDSMTSLVIVQLLKDIAIKNNILVLFTIHQPSTSIVQLFDKILVMNRGELVYQGPIRSEDLTEGIEHYFRQQLHMELKAMSNPSDTIMHLIEEQNAHLDGTHQISNQCLKRAQPFIDSYKVQLKSKIAAELTDIASSSEKAHLQSKSVNHVPLSKEFSPLIRRSLLGYFRNPITFKVRTGMTVLFCFILLSIFWRMKYDYQGMYNRGGFMFFFSINNYMIIVFMAALSFPIERGVFLRDSANQLYSVTAYYLSKNIIETPFVLLNALVYSIIVYFGIGFRDDNIKHFFIFILITLDIAFLALSLGYFFGSAFKDLTRAITITVGTVLPFFFFSGFMVNNFNMPRWIFWLQYLSPLRYSIEAFMRNEFNGNPLSYFDMVFEYNYDIGLWNCILILFCLGLFFRILSGVVLKLLMQKVG